MKHEQILRHVNLHVGAPEIVPKLVKDVAEMKAVRNDASTRFLTPREFRSHLQQFVRSAPSEFTFDGHPIATDDGTDDYLTGHEVLAISQHAMAGHPHAVLKRGYILPDAELRIARLCGAFRGVPLDLHLTATDLDHYTLLLPNGLAGSATNEDPNHIPSWFELAMRIRTVCRHNRLFVWDFSCPERVALPFAMTVLNMDESLKNKTKGHVQRSLVHSEVLFRVFKKTVFGDEYRESLRGQYAQDLNLISELENTLVIRADAMPKEYSVNFETPG